ncbi:MAG TPA: flagellar filament capping protein FliD [Bacillota bacterium]
MANNGLRIDGIVSGMDTQATIDKIMQASRAPLNRLQQKQQKLIWQQEAYRTQNTALSKLRDMLLNLKLTSSYTTKTANSTDEKVATATANSRAGGSYRLEVEALAQSAQNQSQQSLSIRTTVTGGALSASTDAPIVIGDTNNSFSITVDGVPKNITITNGNYASVKDLATNIQTQLNGAGFSEPVYVKAASDGSLMFHTGLKSDGKVRSITLNSVAGNTGLDTLKFANGANSKELSGNAISSGKITINDSNKRFRISVGGLAVQEITLSGLSNGEHTLQEVADEINTQLGALVSTNSEYGKVSVAVTSTNQLKFTYTNPADANNTAIKLQPGSTNDVLQELGFGTGTTSDAQRKTIDSSVSLWNQRDQFINSGFFADKTDDTKQQNGNFAFVINGQAFSFTYRDTLDTIINTINGNAAAGVTAYYDEFSDKLVLNSTAVGDNNVGGAEIQLSDPNGILTQLFGIDQSKETGGTNAIIKLNGSTIQKTSNSFTINNVTFNLTGEGTTTVTVGSNSEDVTKKVQDFVDKYNEIIGAMNTAVDEERATSGSKYTYYEPLTDEQKKEMSEDQITAWEKMAKQGLLHNDSLLSDTLQQMRSSLSRMVTNPLTITGLPVADNVDLTGANHFKVTFNGTTKEIVLDPTTYTRDDLKTALQNKFDLAFGTGAITVGSTGSGALKFTTNNISFTFNDADDQNALGQLGLGNGATVKVGYTALSQIGITTGDYTENGKLYFDQDKFKAALANDADSVIRLLTNFDDPGIVATDSDTVKYQKTQKSELTKGIFYKLYDTVNQNINKILDNVGSTGTINDSILGKQLSELGDQIDTKQDLLSEEEDRLWNQFTAMEQALSRLNSQSSYLTSLLGGGS